MNAFAKIGIIALISAALSQSIYVFIEKGRKKFFNTTMPRFDHLLNQGHSHDILMIGSSRTYLHNDPRVIDSITGMDSYNAGLQGASMFEINMVLDAYLETHNQPKLVVLEASMLSFNVDKSLMNNPTLYFTHLDNKEIRENLNENWKNTTMLKYLPFLRLTQYDDLNRSYGFKGFAGEQEIIYGNVYKGYAENDTAIIKDTVETKNNCDWVKVTAKGRYFLDKMIRTCQQRLIPIVVIYSPEYKQLNYHCPGGDQVMDSFTNICKETGVPFWNYLHDPICEEKKAFLNITHLNRYGAEKFSATLGNDIKKYFDKRNETVASFK